MSDLGEQDPSAKPTVAEVLELLRELEAVRDQDVPAVQRQEFLARKEALLARIGKHCDGADSR